MIDVSETSAVTKKKKGNYPRWARYSTNMEIREAMARKRISGNELIPVLGVATSTFYRWMKTEMPDNMKWAILEAIKKMPDYRAEDDKWDGWDSKLS